MALQCTECPFFFVLSLTFFSWLLLYENCLHLHNRFKPTLWPTFCFFFQLEPSPDSIRFDSKSIIKRHFGSIVMASLVHPVFFCFTLCLDYRRASKHFKIHWSLIIVSLSFSITRLFGGTVISSCHDHFDRFRPIQFLLSIAFWNAISADRLFFKFRFVLSDAFYSNFPILFANFACAIPNCDLTPSLLLLLHYLVSSFFPVFFIFSSLWSQLEHHAIFDPYRVFRSHRTFAFDQSLAYFKLFSIKITNITTWSIDHLI